MSRFNFNVEKNKYMDGDDEIGVYEVVSRLNKGLSNVVFKYNLFDGCITENDEPISESKVLLLLNGDLSVNRADDDYIEKLKEENIYLKNKLHVLHNSLENICNLFNENGI